MEKACQQCSNLFTAQRSTARFCSDACKLKFNRAELRQKKNISEGLGEVADGIVESAEEAYQRRLKGFLAQLEPTEWLTTNTPLDEISLLPKHKITLIYGRPGIGKTTLAHKIAFQVPRTLYIDTEASVTPERLAQLGIEPTSFTLKKMSMVEDIYELLTDEKFLNRYDFIVWDSIGATLCMTQLQASPTEIMNPSLVRAKIINQLMRILPTKLAKTHTTLLLINQEYQEVKASYARVIPPGGEVQRYSSSLTIRLTGEYPKVTAEVKKSRVGESKKGEFKL